jgi:hypothetical protein
MPFWWQKIPSMTIYNSTLISIILYRQSSVLKARLEHAASLLRDTLVGFLFVRVLKRKIQVKLKHESFNGGVSKMRWVKIADFLFSKNYTTPKKKYPDKTFSLKIFK